MSSARRVDGGSGLTSVSFWGSHVGAFGSLGGIRLGPGPGVVPGIAFLAVPVVALLAAGYQAGGGQGSDATDSAFQGAATAVGYGPLVVASYPVVRAVTDTPGFVLEVGLVQLAVVVGICYPAVFGGYVAGQQSRAPVVGPARAGRPATGPPAGTSASRPTSPPGRVATTTSASRTPRSAA